MKTYLVNYANRYYYESQKNNSYTGKNVGGFDQCYSFSVDDINEDFKSEYNHILSQQKGAGYWLWKPYVILTTLESIEDNDIVFYCDSGAEFVDSAKPLIDECVKNDSGFVCFAIDPHITGNPDVGQIKRDALILTDCDDDKYITTNARLASFMVIKNTEYNKKFVRDWLYYCCDERALTDIPNQLGDNYPGFIEHRHDQAIFSVLSKKYGYEAYRDPSQWGIPFIGLIKGDYPQIINHTRNRN